MTEEMVRTWDRHGGTNLGTSRTNPYDPKKDQSEIVLGNIERYQFDYLVAIGGEDTLGVAHKLYLDGVKVNTTSISAGAAWDFTTANDWAIGQVGGGTYPVRHAVDLEVDDETGKIKVLSYAVAQDVGRAINPAAIEGQIQGGIAQGIGWALNEEYFMGSSGAMLNSTLLDYRMPTIMDLPMIETVMISRFCARMR
jgi:CO/xanthine dehydrogenase Mo-binding subunit